jgi:2-phosphosulfolactate phosphatase
MKSTVKYGIEGAKNARGAVVVIDVFRSSNTILMLLARGASSVIPEMELKKAFDLKKRCPDHLLAGERNGIMVEGFDIGNSPHEASQANVAGKSVILSTSGGTRVIEGLRRADRILVGSFGNASALIDNLRRSKTPLVTWLAVGNEGVSRAVEDEVCAEYLRRSAEGNRQDLHVPIKKIMDGEGAKRLRRLRQEEDFAYCLTLDLFDLVPELRRTDPLNAFVIADKL